MAFSTKTEVSDKSFKNTCNMKGQFETMHDIQITEEQVTKLLKNLNPHKAPGPDNITPRVLKEPICSGHLEDLHYYQMLW
jgi:hypothetical protein